MEPLTEVRRLAQAAERLAKARPGKDSLVITVAPRSGADVTVAGRWHELLPRLAEAVDLYRAKAISQGFAHELLAVLESTGRRDLRHLDVTLPGLARALAEKKEAKPVFFRMLDETLAAGPDPREALGHLARLLLVARPFARSMKEAGL
jgi:hypothetical protein